MKPVPEVVEVLNLLADCADELFGLSGILSCESGVVAQCLEVL